MKDVLITIKSVQNPDTEEEDIIELSTDGKYSYKEKSAMFSYMESPITGLDGTKTTFLIRTNKITMNRAGTLNSQMVFEEGIKNHFLYELPFASTTMGIETHRIHTKLDEHGGELEIEYTTEIGHSQVGRNQFLITIREQKGMREDG